MVWGPTSSGQARPEGRPGPCWPVWWQTARLVEGTWEAGWDLATALFGMEEPGFPEQPCHSWTLGKSLAFLVSLSSRLVLTLPTRPLCRLSEQ